MATAERIGWIDFAKGVVITVVVFLHFTRFEYLSKFLMIFHMPFFFVMAGFLLNVNKWGGAEKYNAFSAKLVKRLVVPYFLAELLFYPIWFVVCHEAGYLQYLWGWTEVEPLEAFTAIFIGNGNSIGLVLGQLWFLPTLFCAEIIFVKLFNRLKDFGAEVLALAVVSCSLLGLFFGRLLILPFGMDIALAAQIFLLAGVLIRQFNLVERISLKTCVELTSIVALAFLLNIRVDINFRHYGEPFLFYAGGLAGTLLLMKLSALTTGGKIFSLISSCGRQTMMILVLHPIIANIFYELLDDVTEIPPEEFFTEPIIICAATLLGVLIPLWIAKKFGKLPVLKYFCA